MDLKKEQIVLLQLADSADGNLRPRLLLEEQGSHAKDGITLEVNWKSTGPSCWCIATPCFSDICPKGLFIKA